RSPRQPPSCTRSARSAARAGRSPRPGSPPQPASESRTAPSGRSGDGAPAFGPTCVPAQLNVSDVLAGTPLAVSPLPGSLDASPGTQISFVGAPAGSISALKVTGSRSGAHSGTLR